MQSNFTFSFQFPFTSILKWSKKAVCKQFFVLKLFELNLFTIGHLTSFFTVSEIFLSEFFI